jgi:hypothetical protein
MKDQIVRVNGRYLMRLSLTSGAVTELLRPAAISRLIQISDAFNLYRFTHLRLELYPFAEVQTEAASTPVNANSMAALCFFTQESDTAPTTVTQASECDYSIVLSSQNTVTKGFTVNRSDLMHTGAKWFKTKGGASVEAWEEVQGSIVVVSDMTSGTVNVMVHYCVEFCDPLNVNSTPLVRPVPVSSHPLPTLSEWISAAVAEYRKASALKPGALVEDDTHRTEISKRL